jgi:hypothetical protein
LAPPPQAKPWSRKLGCVEQSVGKQVSQGVRQIERALLALLQMQQWQTAYQISARSREIVRCPLAYGQMIVGLGN